LQVIAGAAAARGRMKRKLVKKCILGEGGKRVEESKRVILGKDTDRRKKICQLLSRHSKTRVKRILPTVTMDASKLDSLTA